MEWLHLTVLICSSGMLFVQPPRGSTADDHRAQVCAPPCPMRLLLSCLPAQLPWRLEREEQGIQHEGSSVLTAHKPPLPTPQQPSLAGPLGITRNHQQCTCDPALTSQVDSRDLRHCSPRGTVPECD